LNEPVYNKVFADAVLPSADILLTYRILFQLLGNETLSKIKDNSEFWKQCCEYFVNESGGKLGNMVQQLVKNMDFSSENIFKVNKVVAGQGSRLIPANFSKICGTTGLIIFLIKDALEYSGIVIDKKTPIQRLIKNYMYTFDVLQYRIERLKKLQAKIFS
jgi:hypothetical protein